MGTTFMDECKTQSCDTLPAPPAAVPAPRFSSDNLDLAGAESLSGLSRLWLFHPFALLVMVGLLPVAPSAVFIALFGWLVCHSSPPDGKGVARGASGRDYPLETPSAGIRKGFAAIGLASVLALAAGGLGTNLLSFGILNGAWAVLTAFAVRSGARTDAQTGWLAGATSMTAAGAFFGIPLALIPGMPLPVKLIPLFLATSLWQLWRATSLRGQARSRAALGAAVTGALATVCYLPGSFLQFNMTWAYEVLCHSLTLGSSLFIPLMIARESARASLPAASTPSLPPAANS
jgi:hypothetical protein